MQLHREIALLASGNAARRPAVELVLAVGGEPSPVSPSSKEGQRARKFTGAVPGLLSTSRYLKS